ncbi:expressed unknown protein [Seminavis robusta]|uniref:G protein-coupled receptor GPR1/2/3 C-terminal domain-containing protein n=1 Tax=Seminavis robusta TaxID=568900 RepID=A0A9N8DHC0_9STRA|nr:expressed unknown protein [Seminavis robusta]|eukprot:Sro89_g046760.1 n/a (410) ;mRNA; f:5511-6933
MAGLTDNQKLGLAVAQKIASTLSLCGSSYILQAIWRDPRKRSKVFYRLLGSMSLTDVLCSTWMFLGTWAVPRGTPGYHNPVGNHATCQAQAFFIWFSVTTLNFNACIALYYLLSIRFAWKEKRIRESIEPFFYLYAIGVGLGVSLPGLFLGYYGPANYWCSSQPTDVAKNAYLIWYIPAWVVLFFVTGVMISIYAHVLATEKKAEKYSFKKSILRIQIESAAIQGTCSASSATIRTALRHQESIRRTQDRTKQSRQVAVQAFFYCIAFYLTLVFPTTVRTMQATKGETPYAILLLHSFFLPAQGFMNCLVYMRQRWSCNRLQKSCCRSLCWPHGSSDTEDDDAHNQSGAHSSKRDEFASHNEILDFFDDDEDDDTGNNDGHGGQPQCRLESEADTKTTKETSSLQTMDP